MNKNVFLIGLAVIIVATAGVLYFKGKNTDTPLAQEPVQNAPQATTTPNEEIPQGDNPYDALISFTDEGYSPSTVTIKKGQTVRFVNNATIDTWPASANHPTHTVYPDKSDDDCLGSSFDACRGLKPGEFWEFTFDEVGTWGFHDHIHANRRGSVVVTE